MLARGVQWQCGSAINNNVSAQKKKTHPQLHMCKLLIQTIQFSFGSVYSSSSGCQKLQAIVKIYHVQRHGTRTHFHFRWRNASHYKVHCRCHVSSVEILEKEIKKKSRKNLPQQKLHVVLQIRLVLYRSNITEDSIKLKYSEVVYPCIHGGKKFKFMSKEMRPHQ